ncbi:MAG: hypothetical protein JRJ84_19885, partial [Deltaproteobacteria bacterium]|nr:hypothetical protein [Deltaproteobacteria bacterium]
GDRALLLALDLDLSKSDAISGDRVYPLDETRWAVGRGTEQGTTWRVIELPDLAQIHHPAWLWTEDAWFGQRSGSGPEPQTVHLKRSLRQAARMFGSTRKVNVLVAAAIAHLRREGRRPLAIVTDETHVVGAGDPARWFVLALLSCLPAQMALPLRVSSYEPLADAKYWDLVLTTTPPDGFDVIEAERVPNNIGDDLVAWYIRKRLLDGEPELVEAIAPLWDDDAKDPWEACLERQLANEGPAAVSIDKDTLVDHFPVAHKLVAMRVRSGVQITEKLANEIAVITLKTGDDSIWENLRTYSKRERTRTFRAWLANSHKYPPSEALLEAIGEVRPPSTKTTEWLCGLLRWLGTGAAPLAAAHLIEQALKEDPQRPGMASRAAAFVELVQALVRLDRPVDALAAVFSPIGETLSRGGTARTLAHAWLLIPREHRTDEITGNLVRLLGMGSDGDAAAWFLWKALYREGSQAQADAVLRHWALFRGTRPPKGRDRFMRRLRGTVHAETWVRIVVQHTPHKHLAQLLEPVISTRDVELWRLAEEKWAAAHNPIPRDRFVGQYAFLPDGAQSLEEQALGLFTELITTTSFPDAQVAEVASAFAEAPQPSLVWMWAAVAASEPDQFDEATIDATVHAYCAAPPRKLEERQLGLAIGRRLGFASTWEPMDHARWLVRLILAPDGDATRYNQELALSMLRSLLKRADGMDRMITMSKAIFELPPDHEALRYFIEDLLPQLWKGGPPEEFVRELEPHKQPTEIRSAWRAAFGSL